jgi:hypothetical protein
VHLALQAAVQHHVADMLGRKTHLDILDRAEAVRALKINTKLRMQRIFKAHRAEV